MEWLGKRRGTGRTDGWTKKRENELPTILELQKVLDQILHQPVLLSHVALEVDHFAEHALIVALQVPDMLRHLVVRLGQTVDLRLHGLDGDVVCPVCRRHARAAASTPTARAHVPAAASSLALGGHLALDVLQSVSSVSLEVRVSKRPCLFVVSAALDSMST